MRINPMKLQKQNELIDDYRHQDPRIMQHFDYNPYQESTYQIRARELKHREVEREQLTKALYTMNLTWDAPESTYINIERLKAANSVVVIGGQQAGLLTGPMYTINKIISVIQFARQQESELQIPVIPVFWIAGEDHDFDEMNHIFLPDQGRMNKYKLSQQVAEKRSVSEISIDEEAASEWLDSLFEQLSETEQTTQLYQAVKDCLRQSVTYVDFFARVIYHVFNDEGLILADSGHPEMRYLEQRHFSEMIQHQPEISEGVHTALQQLKQKGYSVSLDTEPDDAHLFYHLNDERILLRKDDEGNWVGKQNEVLLTEEEMLDTARRNPLKLSNNVVTRPVMQECLFPTLAFIGGPGEVGYWSALRPAFQALDMAMPPVLPRLSFTFIDRHIEKLLKKYGIKDDDAVNHGVEARKVQWLASQSNPPVQQLSEEIRQAIDKAHQPLRDVARNIRPDLGELADKNLYYLHSDIEYLEERIIRALTDASQKEIDEFNRIHNALYPNNGLQERMWNPLPWVNDYGIHFMKQLAMTPCSFETDHHIVYL